MNTKSKILIISFVIGYVYILFSGCQKDNVDLNNNNPAPVIVFDTDGNTYNTVNIGTQIWMAENLKTTRYNDYTKIEMVNDNYEWLVSTNGGYCWYNLDEGTNSIRYGALYNWHAVNTGNLCPSGWHVPTKEEIETLADFLGGSDLAGGRMKQTDTLYWAHPNVDATNVSGFSARGGGKRIASGSFFSLKTMGHWWLGSDGVACCAWFASIKNDEGNLFIQTGSKKHGFSVRCLKD